MGRKIIVGFVVWVIVVLATIPKPSKKVVDIDRILDLPSIKKIADDEVEMIQEEIRIQEFEEEQEKRRERDVVSRGIDRGLFTATAYDLTVRSCGKKQSHPAYGITANGTNLKGHTLESARAIAVDPKVIKLGSKVYIEFTDEEYKHLEGIYTAVDTGGAIKGRKIDIFFGDTGDKDTNKSVWDFGKRKVKITVLENDEI